MSVSVNIGTLRHRMLFQQVSSTQDAYGQPLTSWTDVATVWAEILPLSGRELVNAQAVAPEVSHQITIRWKSELSNTKAVAAMRAVYKGRYFNITAPMNVDERNRVIILLATEGLNNG
jgi:SPP1 family predicted phage head-tail adaptor